MHPHLLIFPPKVTLHPLTVSFITHKKDKHLTQFRAQMKQSSTINTENLELKSAREVVLKIY